MLNITPIFIITFQLAEFYAKLKFVKIFAINKGNDRDGRGE